MIQNRFEEVFDDFLKSVPSSTVKKYIQVSWKTLSDGFRKFFVDQRLTNRNKFGASGISENGVERE